MILVRQAVPHRNAAVSGQGLHMLLLKSTEFDTVEHPAQHPGRILNTLLMAQLDLISRKVSGIASLVRRAHGKRATGPGGRLLKDQRDILSLQAVSCDPLLLLRFQVRSQIQKIQDLLRGKIFQCQKTSSF